MKIIHINYHNKNLHFSLVIFLLISLSSCTQNGIGVGTSIDIEPVEASPIQGPEIPFGYAYVTKYVCGSHSSSTPSVNVLAGDYATQINVVNLGRGTEFFKKIFVLEGKQRPTKPAIILKPEKLDHNQAMSITCTDIANHLGMTLPPPFFEGLVEIVTSDFIPFPTGERIDPLEVRAVYTYHDIER